jgi:glucokinase
MLYHVGTRYIAVPSESGHADFAARTERDVQLMRWLTDRYGRAEVEGVVSGRGVLNIHQAMHREPCKVVVDLAHPDAAAEITAAGLAGRCAGCIETLDVFVEAYGAEAGNLALRSMSTGGMFVGGGIAPKILPALTDGRFMHAFRRKAPFEALLSTMPVCVVLNPDTGLLGAAVHASENLKYEV